ncbi:hypothetical protein C9I98_08550 [Photobacterium sanctipauli]|uniref:Sensor domain-containing diguanylate cyclase n=3 Tax=Photobacterium sanctipauli TaxID=1342794 RepID=A0A2T3NUZ6_9GAMM|nr:diguanylate cyclase [Photobacterium sanctipauli]PSW20100.1 hypothetical protein C9I98_08550 [Photobacterium sanctipauli]
MVIPVIITFFLLFVINIAYSYITVVETRKENLLTRTNVLSEGVAINLKKAVIHDDELSAREILDVFKVEPWVIDVIVINEKGNVFAEYDNSISSSSNIVIENYSSFNANVHDYSFSDNFLRVSFPIYINSDLYGNMLIKASLDSIEKVKEEVFNFFIVLLLPMIMCCLVLVQQLESWVVGPILQLNRAMRITVNNHNTTKRLDVQSSDEIGSLVKCFNEMMGSLEARDSYIQKTLEQLANEVTFADDVISTINHGLVVLSRDGKVKMANSTYYSLFPNSKDQMIGQSFNKSTCDEIWNTCESWLSKMHNETKFEAIIESVKYHNSERFYFITGCRLNNGEELLLVLEDITDKHLATQQQQLASRIFEQSTDGIAVIDNNNQIVMINPTLCRLLNRQADSVINEPVTKLFSSIQITSINSILFEQRRYWNGEIIEVTADGIPLPMAVHANLIGTGSDSRVVINISDLSGDKEIERLDYLAHHDELTGLANRTKLYTVLEGMLSTPQNSEYNFALLYIDLDGFKPVNDTYGHHVGDYVLQQIALRFQRVVRDSDFVSRLAGDEFVIVLNPITSYEVGYTIASRIKEVISESIYFEGYELRLGASIGFSMVKSDKNTTIESVLAKADSAMYKAKKTNNKGIYYTD